ncbi:MAG: VOC family protein [Deltaproteobacteria bacterium]|nr:VOC family protein [Deltaproteobacteria bacterium]
MTPKAMSHVALCVRDFDRSLHFYRDLLGFQVSQEGTEVEGSQYQQGIYERENRKMRFAILRAGKESAGPYGMSEDAPIIALLAPVDTPPTGTGIKVDQVGISHVGFWVTGLDAVYEDLKSKGVTFVASPHTLGRTKAGTICSAFAQDPDGILIQLDEMVPA